MLWTRRALSIAGPLAGVGVHFQKPRHNLNIALHKGIWTVSTWDQREQSFLPYSYCPSLEWTRTPCWLHQMRSGGSPFKGLWTSTSQPTASTTPQYPYLATSSRVERLSWQSWASEFMRGKIAYYFPIKRHKLFEAAYMFVKSCQLSRDLLTHLLWRQRHKFAHSTGESVPKYSSCYNKVLLITL